MSKLLGRRLGAFESSDHWRVLARPDAPAETVSAWICVLAGQDDGA